MKDDLAKAVSLLKIQEDHVDNPEKFIDFGILISLYYLYMHIIEHALTDKRIMSIEEEHCIECDSWYEFQKFTRGTKCEGEEDGFNSKVAKTLDLLVPLQIQ